MSKGSYIIGEGGRLTMIAGQGSPLRKARPPRPRPEPDPGIVLHLPERPSPEQVERERREQAEQDRIKREDAAANARIEARQKRMAAAYFANENGGGSSPSPQPRQSRSGGGVTLAEAAEQSGLSEEELTTRILGKARLKVVDGDLVVSVADLNRLAAEGAIPKPSERGKVDRMVAEVEGKRPRDAAAEARTDRMEKALGIDGTGDAAVEDRAAKVAAQLGVDGFDNRHQGEQKPAPRSGAVHVKAEDRKPYRLGRPRRWSEAR